MTLVVPVYNMERYLNRCMDSLLQQTCREYEIILVDDGSTDSSGSLCDAYAVRNPDLVRVFHKPNGGLSSARNAGIDAARGEWIVFPDPDDWVEPDYVESFLYFQSIYPADMICLGHWVDTENSSKNGNHSSNTTVMHGREGRHGLLLDQMMGGFCWNKLYRIDTIREHGLRFSNEMGDTEDLCFTYKYLCHCGSVCHVPSKQVYHYYQHSGSSTRRSFVPEKINSLKTFAYIMSDCAAEDPALARAAAEALCTEAVNLLWDYEHSGLVLPEIRKCLLLHIRRQLPKYLVSDRIEAGRKFQALLAAVSPRVYAIVKSSVRKIRG